MSENSLENEPPCASIDINQNFCEDINTKINHSMSGCESDENHDFKRLKINSIPILNQYSGKIIPSSPRHIDMLETQTSPMKHIEMDKNENSDLRGIQDAIKKGLQNNENESNINESLSLSPIEHLEKLTPLKNHHDHEIQDVSLGEHPNVGSHLYQKKLDEFIELIKNHGKQMTLLKKEIFDLECTNINLNENIDVKNIHIAKLNEVIEQYSQKQIILEENIKEYEELNIKNEKMTDRINILKDKIKEVKNELNMSLQNSQILQEKYETQFERNEDLIRDLEQEKSKLLKFETEQKELNNELEEANSKISSLQNQLDEYVNILEENKLLVKEKSDIIVDLEHDLESKNEYITTLKKRLDAFTTSGEKTIDDMKLEIQSLNEINENLNKTLSNKTLEYDRRVDSLKCQLEEADEKIKCITNNYADSMKQIEDLTESKKKQDIQVDTLTHESEEISSELTSKIAQLTELTAEIHELKTSQIYLRDSIEEREINIREWKNKFELKEKEVNELNIELESYQFKSGNLEAEHLAELENLHEQMTQLQLTLKENLEKIGNLNETNNLLNSQLEESRSEVANLMNKLDKTSESLPEVKWHEEIENLKKQLINKDADTNHRLQLLAEDLYIQYSSKHEQKVKMLKKGYETKYQETMTKLELENRALKEETAQLQSKLEIERKEKQNLIKLLDK